MKQYVASIFLVFIFVFCVTACEKSDSLDSAMLGLQPAVQETENIEKNVEMKSTKVSLPVKSSDYGLETGKIFNAVSRTTRVQEVIGNQVFGDYGRLIFPVDRTIDDSLTLENVGDILTWYHYINPDKTVEIVNYLGEQAAWDYKRGSGRNDYTACVLLWLAESMEHISADPGSI